MKLTKTSFAIRKQNLQVNKTGVESITSTLTITEITYDNNELQLIKTV